ncbi:MAG: hypothetical protein ACI8VW_001710 [bacterium]|jgi:hypothetical protein
MLSSAAHLNLVCRMTELTITLTGEVRESNFEEWKDGLVERIRSVDAALSEDDDFTSANDSIRQFRDAEQMLKGAKQSALEQAADINRLFDAVDAVTEETRQARLTLERRIRVRRQELKLRALQVHIDNNAATLDALTPAQQALFQDRTTLLSLPFDELESTIAQRIGVWQATLTEQATQSVTNSSDAVSHDNTQSSEDVDAEHALRVPNISADESIEYASDTGVVTDDVLRAWRVTIDLSAPRAKADQLFTRVRDRWKSDRAVVSVDLSAMD